VKRKATTARFRPHSLDAVNFLLADVRGALGPIGRPCWTTTIRW
jgi:hypothetical protein